VPMKLVARTVVVAVTALATFYVVYWLPFSLIMPGERSEWIPYLGSLLCAFLAGWFVWRRSASAPSGLVSSVVVGALVTGAVGFSAGFFGPLVFAPGANQGPLLGLFITGPIGFLFGAGGGAIYWFARGKDR